MTRSHASAVANRPGSSGATNWNRRSRKFLLAVGLRSWDHDRDGRSSASGQAGQSADRFRVGRTPATSNSRGA